MALYIPDDESIKIVAFERMRTGVFLDENKVGDCPVAL
jgi:hypothetical protein